MTELKIGLLILGHFVCGYISMYLCKKDFERHAIKHGYKVEESRPDLSLLFVLFISGYISIIPALGIYFGICFEKTSEKIRDFITEKLLP